MKKKEREREKERHTNVYKRTDRETNTLTGEETHEVETKPNERTMNRRPSVTSVEVTMLLTLSEREKKRAKERETTKKQLN